MADVNMEGAKRYTFGCHLVRHKDNLHADPQVLLTRDPESGRREMKERRVSVLTSLDLEDDDQAFYLGAFVVETEWLLNYELSRKFEGFLFRMWISAFKQKWQGAQASDLTAQQIVTNYCDEPFVKFVEMMKAQPGTSADTIDEGLVGLRQCVRSNVNRHWARYKRLSCLKRFRPRRKPAA